MLDGYEEELNEYKEMIEEIVKDICLGLDRYMTI